MLDDYQDLAMVSKQSNGHISSSLESKLQPKYSVIEEEDAKYEDDTSLAFKDLR